MKAEESSTGHDVHGNSEDRNILIINITVPSPPTARPEPVHDIRSVGLRDDLTAEVGDGWEVHADGDLQQEEGEEGDDCVGGCGARPENISVNLGSQ